jgi:carboxymethylenebutenolidase
MPPTTRRVQIVAEDGHRLTGWKSEPAAEPRGGVVVLHAVYGLTDRMRAVCERWAAAGYTAVAPALFDRIGPDIVHPYQTPGEGTKSYNMLTPEQIFMDIRAAALTAGGLDRTAISGFCTGGTWAWKAAAAMDFPAQVNFYGSAIPALLDLTPRCPSILHYGDTDHIVTVAQVEAIRARHPELELHVYPGAGHAFENPDQANFNAGAAALAWQRSIAFMDHHLHQ